MNLDVFFTTGQGVLLLGLMAAAVVLLWDWRVALGTLFVIQVGVATLVVNIEDVAAQTMLVQTLVIGLCCLMLATSGIQMHMARSGRQSGGWFFRLLVLVLLGIALESLDLTFVLPEFAPAIARIFGWIGLIALLMLSLGDNPLFTAVALLIWCVLGQALASVYAPAPEITAAIGLVQLALGLTCSYLIVAEGLPRMQRRRHGAFGPPAGALIHVPAPAGAAPVVVTSTPAAQIGTGATAPSVMPMRPELSAPIATSIGAPIAAPSDDPTSPGSVESAGVA